ncbi:SDR family NAD(P)-dependent oxidoreductase [Streptomyces sp. NPDC086554]|uniref:SDR family NAD(P)-dependent oxidoreductase n=1 Tax=Streptomyces sp. NPDC086554 TaxID=3154864 RepID=UPI00341FF74F
MAELLRAHAQGAGRGLGTDIARQALDAGHRVVATGRKPDQVLDALGGDHDNLLVAALDITDLDQARHVAQQAVEAFGRIDVLVNNAANFHAGCFEESPTPRCAGRSRRACSAR